jgi:hypothetical protein
VVDFRAPLNDRQLEVLRWIAQGCPEGVMKGHLHKQIAVALQNRRLVQISKKGGSWRAVATDAGRHYAEHGAYPEGLWTKSKVLPIPVLAPAVPQRSLPATERKPATSQVEPGASPGLDTIREVARPKRVSVTEQLIADVIAAGGELRINAEEDKANYDVRVAAAIRHGKVPEGKLLVIERGASWRTGSFGCRIPPNG